MKEWKKIKLGDVLTAVDYGTASKSDANGKYPVLRMGNLENGYLVWDDLVYTSSEEEYAKYELNKGDILFNRTNSRDKVGKTSIYRGERQAIFAGYLVRLKVNKECDPFYINYCLNSKEFADFCRSVRTDAIGQSNINAQVLQTYSFLLPPLEEQKKIAETLSVWDDAIEKTEKLIALKETEYQANVSALIFENRKFAQKCKIGDVLEIRNIRATATDDRPLYSLTIEDGVTPKSERYDRLALVKDKDSKKYKVVCDGDIVFNPANLRWGAIARANLDRDVVVSPIYEVLYVKGKEFDAKYISQYLTSEKMISYYATKTEGTLIERKEVKLDAFLQIDIYVEKNIENQIKIADILDSAKKEINLLKQQLGNYKKQKQGLMQKLLTGQWRVK
ncbi:MAG: restriction endonuclease subunit S [Fibrobacter sp.]|nr:restriction endonuclease subunit S [Fibrobacter sp.]